MYRYLHVRLRAAWRAGTRPPWPDVALAAVLSIAALWLTVHSARSGSDMRTSPFPADLPFPPDRPFPPAPGPDVPAAEIARSVVLDMLMTVPLAGRRRWPLAGLIVQFVGLVAFNNGVNEATLAALVIGAYSLARYGRSAWLSMGTLLAAATVTALAFDNTTPDLPGWAGAFAILLPVGLFGTTIRAGRNRVRASDERAEALERGQEAATRLAVARERARIARELHDVVSHHVSVMTIQAGAAGKVLDAEPELARGALSAIEDSGREAMTELRHLLGVLTPGPTDDLLHPQPGLDQLDALVDNVRGAGQPVSVRHTPVALPRGVDLAAYRVIQEALTNALRYAPGARTEVVIALAEGSELAEGRELVVEVTNDAAPAGAGPASAPGGTGSGLLGLAERLRVYQGTLETSRRLGGGFSVRARMPLSSEAPFFQEVPFFQETPFFQEAP